MERLFFPLIAIAIIVAVVFIQEGQRRIPIQYAKRMVGRRMTAGGSTYMPLRVNMAGVIPIIFAAAVMAFPPTIAQYFPQTQGFVNEHFTPRNLIYMLLEGFLIVIFTYFYTAVQFNPVDQADNLRKHGGYIPGIRPARRPPVPRPRADAADASGRALPGDRRVLPSSSSATAASLRRPRARSAAPPS